MRPVIKHPPKSLAGRLEAILGSIEREAAKESRMNRTDAFLPEPPRPEDVAVLVPMPMPLEDVRKMTAFSVLDPNADLPSLLATCDCFRYESNTVVFRQGQKGLRWFVILSGLVAVNIRADAAPEASDSEDGTMHEAEDNDLGERVTILGAGQQFGHLALDNAAPRKASIVCIQPTVLLVVPKTTYVQNVQAGSRRRHVAQLQGLRQMPQFRDIPEQNLSRLSDNVEFHTVPRGTQLVAEGTQADRLFIILRGQCRVHRILRFPKQMLWPGPPYVHDRTIDVEFEVGILKQGDHFDVVSLAERGKHQAAVVALTEVDYVSVLEFGFRMYLGERVKKHLYRQALQVPSRLQAASEFLEHRRDDMWETNKRFLAEDLEAIYTYHRETQERRMERRDAIEFDRARRRPDQAMLDRVEAYRPTDAFSVKNKIQGGMRVVRSDLPVPKVPFEEAKQIAEPVKDTVVLAELAVAHAIQMGISPGDAVTRALETAAEDNVKSIPLIKIPSPEEKTRKTHFKPSIVITQSTSSLTARPEPPSRSPPDVRVFRNAASRQKQIKKAPVIKPPQPPQPPPPTPPTKKPQSPTPLPLVAAGTNATKTRMAPRHWRRMATRRETDIGQWSGSMAGRLLARAPRPGQLFGSLEEQVSFVGEKEEVIAARSTRTPRTPRTPKSARRHAGFVPPREPPLKPLNHEVTSRQLTELKRLQKMLNMDEDGLEAWAKMLESELAHKFADDVDDEEQDEMDGGPRRGLSVDEFTQVMKGKFGVLDGRLAQRLFESFDADANRGVELSEFVLALALCVRGDPERRLRIMFRACDTDHDGFLSRVQLRRLLGKHFNFCGLDDEDDVTERVDDALDRWGLGEDGREVGAGVDVYTAIVQADRLLLQSLTRYHGVMAAVET